MTRLIRASEDVLATFGTRTDDGRRITAEWGEPIGHCSDSDEYIYEPTFTATDDGYSIVSTEELEGLRREREVAREWVAAHEYVTDPNSPDTESLERYSAACIEVLAVVSQQWPRAVLEGAKP